MAGGCKRQLFDDASTQVGRWQEHGCPGGIVIIVVLHEVMLKKDIELYNVYMGGNLYETVEVEKSKDKE